MAKRKSVKIEDIKAKANHVFMNSVDEDRAGRKSIEIFVSSLLMDAGQYNGFRYLTAEACAKRLQGSTIGIKEVDGENVYPDDTRIAYF